MGRILKEAQHGKTVGHPKLGASREQSIYELIPKDGSRIQLKELKKKADECGYGYDTLYNHLGRLEKELGVIKREVDSSTRPPSVFYRRCPDTVLIWKGSKCWSAKFTQVKTIEGTARIVFEEDFRIAEAQRQRFKRLLDTKPSKRRDDKIAAEIADGLSTMAALIGRALAKIKEGKGISITPDEYVSRVLEVRLHPQVAQLARWVAEDKIKVPHLHDALMILASRQGKVPVAKKRGPRHPNQQLTRHIKMS